MSKDPKLTSGFKKSYLTALTGLAVVTALVTFNEFVFRFSWSAGLFDGVSPAARLDSGAGIFRDHSALFVAYAVSLSLAALLGPWALFSAKTDPWSPRMRARVLCFLAVSALAALAGGGLGIVSGDGMIGGLDSVFYWCGLAAIWLGFIAMAGLAFIYRDRDILFEWLLHNTGLANLAILIYPLTFVLLPLGLTIDEAYVGSVTLCFTGMIALTFFVVLRLRKTGALFGAPQKTTDTPNA